MQLYKLICPIVIIQWVFNRHAQILQIETVDKPFLVHLEDYISCRNKYDISLSCKVVLKFISIIHLEALQVFICQIMCFSLFLAHQLSWFVSEDELKAGTDIRNEGVKVCIFFLLVNDLNLVLINLLETNKVEHEVFKLILFFEQCVEFLRSLTLFLLNMRVVKSKCSLFHGAVLKGSKYVLYIFGTAHACVDTVENASSCLSNKVWLSVVARILLVLNVRWLVPNLALCLLVWVDQFVDFIMILLEVQTIAISPVVIIIGDSNILLSIDVFHPLEIHQLWKLCSIKSASICKWSICFNYNCCFRSWFTGPMRVLFLKPLGRLLATLSWGYWLNSLWVLSLLFFLVLLDFIQNPNALICSFFNHIQSKIVKNMNEINPFNATFDNGHFSKACVVLLLDTLLDS